MSQDRQFSASTFQRWMTALCLLVLLVFTCAEAVHLHRDRAVSCEGNRCLICLSVHATAPATTAHAPPVLFAVAILLAPYEIRANGITSRLELFTRPPPRQRLYWISALTIAAASITRALTARAARVH